MWPRGRRLRGAANRKEVRGLSRGRRVWGVAKVKEREGHGQRGLRVQCCTCLPTYVFEVDGTKYEGW